MLDELHLCVVGAIVQSDLITAEIFTVERLIITTGLPSTCSQHIHSNCAGYNDKQDIRMCRESEE